MERYSFRGDGYICKRHYIGSNRSHTKPFKSISSSDFLWQTKAAHITDGLLSITSLQIIIIIIFYTSRWIISKQP